MRQKDHQSIWLLLPVILLLLMLLWEPTEQEALSPAMAGVSIVIDAGHGGVDAGVTGSGGTPEDDVNLAIALKLGEYCRRAGANVTMTRESEQSLSHEGKRADLDARIDLAKQAEADLFLSLHCNSYIGDADQHGAQVFYWEGNEEGKMLAEALQASLAGELKNTERTAMAHGSSYLLKNLPMAAVIVEMGFLTNPAEEQLLTEDGYQWEMAWAIYLGTVEMLAK